MYTSMLSLVPRPFLRKGRRRAWYPLTVHAPPITQNLGDRVFSRIRLDTLVFYIAGYCITRQSIYSRDIPQKIDECAQCHNNIIIHVLEHHSK